MVAGRGLRSRILGGGRNCLGVRPGSFLALSGDAPPSFDPVRVYPRLEWSTTIDLFPAILLGPVRTDGPRPAVVGHILLAKSEGVELAETRPGASDRLVVHDAVFLDVG